VKELLEYIDKKIDTYQEQDGGGAFVVFSELMRIRLYLNQLNKENIFIKKTLAKNLLELVNSEINSCVDNPNYRGEPPDYLIKLKNSLNDCLEGA
jgi:hypothetical protein